MSPEGLYSVGEAGTSGYNFVFALVGMVTYIFVFPFGLGPGGPSQQETRSPPFPGSPDGARSG